MQESFRQDDLHDWIDVQTTHLDVVASWENLCLTYDELRFSDSMTDTARLDEYKWIIKEMNKFLSRIRTRLMKCKNLSTAKIVLEENLIPQGQVNLSDRKSLAYHKLRQQWIMNMIQWIQTMMLEELEKLEEKKQDGWGNYDYDGEYESTELY